MDREELRNPEGTILGLTEEKMTTNKIKELVRRVANQIKQEAEEGEVSPETIYRMAHLGWFAINNNLAFKDVAEACGTDFRAASRAMGEDAHAMKNDEA